MLNSFGRSLASSTRNLRFLSSSSTTHFGFEQVRAEDKEGRVREVFDNVADTYDVMNDLMSGGLHRYWKDYLLETSAVSSLATAARVKGTSLDILDVAGGTGDVAFRFVDATGVAERAKSSGEDAVSITVCDINTEMLRVGEQRARDRFGQVPALKFVEGNAQDLEFEDNSFDLYTIAFGLRNVTDVDKALSEAHRVLKPGGRFMCLEFSQVECDSFRQLYDLYSFNVIPMMGQVVANDRHSYQYLVESIRQFSNQEELEQRMRTSGMEEVMHTSLTGGIVALHEGWKRG